MSPKRSENNKKFQDKSSLPIHSLQRDESLITVKEIQHKNPYDFTREHRHTYFEILFFETGGGNQLIDFIKYPLKKESCYIIFPGQVHLMNRDPKAVGFLIQFNEEMIASSQLQLLLRKQSFSDKGAVLFESNSKNFKSVFQSLLFLKNAVEQRKHYSSEIANHLLHALLFELIGENNSTIGNNSDPEKKLLQQFQTLLESNFSTIHSVNKYAALLNTTEKKISAVTKKYLGENPLQLIHSRLLLEIKRILLFENTSYKEIAFKLGFDSAATFSQFIKNKTGYTPSELHTHLVEIHK